MNREERVKEFRDAGESPYFGEGETHEEKAKDTVLILTCISEECNEFFAAVEAYQFDQCDDNRQNLCKEWADLQYVVSQAAVFFGIPAEEAFTRVADNNMTKVVDGKLVKREDGKILKPEGYEPANMEGL